jgi:hypothetical protein
MILHSSQAESPWRSFGIVMPEEYVIQAKALLKKNDIDEALAALTACQEFADIGGGDWFEGKEVRLKGNAC